MSKKPAGKKVTVRTAAERREQVPSQSISPLKAQVLGVASLGANEVHGLVRHQVSNLQALPGFKSALEWGGGLDRVNAIEAHAVKLAMDKGFLETIEPTIRILMDNDDSILRAVELEVCFFAIISAIQIAASEEL